MKKLLIAAMMMFATSAAFAGDSEPLKNILKAKTYAEASQLLQQNLSQLANAQEKAKAYNYLSKLALEKFDKENAIQTANLQAQITKSKEQPYDTLGFYGAAYDALQAAMECAKYDNQPNEKGKVSPKYIKTLGPLVANARLQLVNAGNYYAQRNDKDNVLKYWGTFLDTDNDPMFASTKESEKAYIGQVSYFSALYAYQAKQYDRADKYADLALLDSAMHKEAMNFKIQMGQMNLHSKADSLKYVETLKGMFAKDASNETIFGALCNMYSGMNMTSELKTLIDDRISSYPNSFTAWAMKGQMLMNDASKAQNPNWDECINCYKKAVELDPKNPVVLVYLGFSINAKASMINGNPAAQKELYNEAVGYLEKARDLDPDRQKANWAYPLYQAYYQIYGATDSRTKELENMLKK